MKKYILLILLFTGMVNAQNVFIPDTAFKMKLQGLGVDTNFDGEIQQSEALAVTTLDLMSSGISNLEGIGAFTNLEVLNCSYNSLVSVDFSALTNLVSLDCQNNDLTSLSITPLTSLTNLNCRHNELITLTVQNANLQNLVCSNNFLQTLNVSQDVGLQYLMCAFNNLPSLDVSQNVNLKYFYCDSNAISNLDVTNNILLEEFYCTNNQLTSINILSNPALMMFGCSNNSISSLDLSNAALLQRLECVNIGLTNLDLSNLINLKTLWCGSNLFTTLDLFNQTKLIDFHCVNSLLTNLDLSRAGIDVGDINLYDVGGSASLTYVNIKNGRPFTWFSSISCPNLSFVCADDSNVEHVQANLLADGHADTQVSSYCSFVPGGHYNTIAGLMTFDADSNGCDANDEKQSHIRININDGTDQGAAYTNNLGNYTFFTQTGSFEITPSVENQSWFNFLPATATVAFADNNDNTTNQDFCIIANGVHPDVEIVIAPIIPARPGFDAKYQIVYRNKGNQTLSGNITFIYDEAVLDFVNATMVPDAQNAGLLNWNYADLMPFENRSFYITLNVNAPTETPAVNNGDLLHYEATITPVIGDEIPADNLFTYNQTVIGSFDPNDITCIEGAVVPPSEIGNYLHYIINFENTGTFPAENIVVKTEVDPLKFDINSLQLMNANFPVDARITGNKVEFIFENIQLPIGGHGHILLKIKTNNTLVTGDAVAKRADIFFDYNFPVDTGLANTVFQTLSNSEFDTDDSVMIAPNPASNEVTIQADYPIKSVQLYDVQGRIISTTIVDELESKLNISSHSKGIYFLKITTEKGALIQKLLKE